ncbi:MAG: BtrH N-terminal domain-containing protein [Coprobacillus sp.]
MKKIVDGFCTSGGKHCITTALKQVFDYHGCTMSEEMIFGLGAGSSFCYINLHTSPMVSGRTKPFVFEDTLAKRLNIQIKCKKSKEYNVAFQKSIQLLNENKPVLIYVDMPYLGYLNLNKNSHFGGHAVVLIGYDDENEKFYISDRDNSDYPIRTPKGNISKDYHCIDYSELEQARSSSYRPFPAQNKYLDIKIEQPVLITETMIFSAVQEACQGMLNAPAQLLGLNGIRKFSKEVIKWNVFDDSRLKTAAITNYFQISADGGTGGGIFRKMYGDFLIEASLITNIQDLKDIGIQYHDVSLKWDGIASMFWELSETLNRELLKDISSIINDIYNEEKSLLLRLNDVVQ